MANVTISLPEDLKAYLDARASEDRSEPGDYVGGLLRRDQELRRFRDMIQQGAESPIVGEADEAWFEGLRERIRNRTI
jgi:antitoxin ParD1/3/4